MARAPLFRMTSGLNNVLEPHRLKYGEDGGCPLAEAVNVVVDIGGGVLRRKPRRKVFDGATHSFFSYGQFALFRVGENLYRLMPDETVYLVSAGMGSGATFYTFFMGRIYVSGPSKKLSLDESMAYPWQASIPGQDPSDTRQLGFPSSFTRIFEHAGRMCLVDGANLWIGEPFNAGCVDIGAGPINFGSDIIDAASVGTGLYISNRDSTFFLSGKNRQDMALTKILDMPAVSGTMVVCPVSQLALSRPSGAVGCVWNSGGDVFVGDGAGDVTNMTDVVLNLAPSTFGSAAIYDGYYIFSREI